jgi:putative ABC transport system substrate-binding protein
MAAGPPVDAKRLEGFLQGLKDLGYVEGRNLRIEWRYTQETNDAPWGDLAQELVRLRVDVIVTDGLTPAALAAKQATTSIPVVFAGATGPVETGLVESLARPGGNVTGVSSSVPGVEGMYAELLRELVPGLSDVVHFIVADNTATASSFERFRTAAEGVGIQAEAAQMVQRSPGVLRSMSTRSYGGRILATYQSNSRQCSTWWSTIRPQSGSA